jgi:hypothetical protein
MYRHMTTFFDRPNDQTWKQQERAEKDARDAEARAAIMQLANELGVALSALGAELARRGVPMDVEVITSEVYGKKGQRRQTASFGRGWVVSTAAPYKGEHSVCLMADGTVRMADKVDEAERAENRGTLNFQQYPVHEYFPTVRDYAETHGKDSTILAGTHPDIPFEGGLYGVNHLTQNTAINVEYLERTVRATGRLLLGR